MRSPWKPAHLGPSPCSRVSIGRGLSSPFFHPATPGPLGVALSGAAFGREQQLGLRTQDIPRGLIYPVCFHNCVCLPPDFKDIQHKDLSPWNRASPAFRRTLGYDDFLSVMQGIANELAALLQAVPAWRQDFPIHLPATAGGIRRVAMEVPRL
jgi:hypothetical protein